MGLSTKNHGMGLILDKKELEKNELREFTSHPSTSYPLRNSRSNPLRLKNNVLQKQINLQRKSHPTNKANKINHLCIKSYT